MQMLKPVSMAVVMLALTCGHANAAPRHHLPPATGFARGLGEGLAHILGINIRHRAVRVRPRLTAGVIAWRVS